jgi:hypothetical protein
MPGSSRRRAPEQAQAQTSSPGQAIGPGADIAGSDAEVGTGEQSVQASETPTLDALAASDPQPGMPPDEIADILVRATRGNDVPPADLTSAQLSVELLDTEGTAIVLERLRQAGVADQVVERGVLDADVEHDMYARFDAVVQVSALATFGFPDAQIAAQIAWAEQAYAAQGITLVVEVHGPMDEDETRGILALEGDPNQAEFNDGDRDAPARPGIEIEALLAAAWDHGPSASAHVVFLAGHLPGADGATFQPGLYETSQPGAVVAEGSTHSVFGHEIGHLLGLGHLEDELGTEREGENLMATDAPREGRLSTDQVTRIKRSLLAQLVPQSDSPRPEQPGIGGYPDTI